MIMLAWAFLVSSLERLRSGGRGILVQIQQSFIHGRAAIRRKKSLLYHSPEVPQNFVGTRKKTLFFYSHLQENVYLTIE